MPDFQTLVLKRLDTLTAANRRTLEAESLPAYLPKRRWFAAKDVAIDSIRISYCIPFGDPNRPVLLSELCVESAGRSDLYQLPLGFLDESDFGTALPQQLALARVRRGPQVGLMTDAFALEQFSAAVIQGLRDELVLPCSDGEIRFVPMPQLDDLQLPEQPEVRFISAEQSNSSAIIDNKVMIKLLRRVAAGIHPELEMGGFLTARGFAHISGMLGQVSRINKQGEPVALMVIQHFLDSQGDAWVWTLNNLDRAVRDEIAGGVSMHENQFSALDELQAFNRLLGQRLGEMHMALAADTDDAAFAYEITSPANVEQWAQSISAQLEQALQRIDEHRSTLERRDAAAVGQLLQRRDQLLAQVKRLAARTVGACAPACMATCTSGRFWWCRAMRISSTSRASRPVRWTNGERNTARSRMSQACCARSNTPRP